MKFDMHCHTKEGSIDAKVDLESYVKELMRQGFDGMLVTDHNSYKGHDKWAQIEQRVLEEGGKDFIVLRGIEYDTSDGGHILAILPEAADTRILEIRGMNVARLEKLVHELGGILGPAHPYGNGFFAFMNTAFGKRNERMMKQFDFTESFNACSKPFQNLLAKKLAARFRMVEFAGSDAHKMHVIGSAYTIFDEHIRNNDDLIRVVKSGQKTIADGDWSDKVRTKQGKIHEQLGIIGYYIYNKFMAGINSVRRYRAFRIYRIRHFRKRMLANMKNKMHRKNTFSS